MTDIRQPLSRLGLGQYVQIFIDEGFDTWETVCHVTESDLDHLGVKLGHRRVLQREIAFARGVSVEHLSSPTRTHQAENGRPSGLQDGVRPDGQVDSALRGKRKYRRHPKIDEHAPERPPSAYVIFSNKIREELKPQNLSFTDIAKRVGERWQMITPEEKGPHERTALALKEQFHVKMNAYKLTENYRNYMEYLADFKSKASSNTDGKRPKLDQEDSKDSTASNASVNGTDGIDVPEVGSTVGESRCTVESMSSTGNLQGGLPSPPSLTGRPIGTHGSLATILPHSNVSPMSTSSSSPSVRRDSSSGPMPVAVLQPRLSIESSTDPASYSGIGQRTHLNSPYRDGPSHQSSSSTSVVDPRLSRSHDSQGYFNERHQTGRTAPKLIHQNTSSSSNLSLGSGASNGSSAASSIYAVTRNADGDDRPQLPPLSAKSLHKPGVNMADYALCSSQPPSSTGDTPPSLHHTPHQTPYNGSPSQPGMKFESLQLPLPYNVAFGQQPLSRPDNEGKLANIFDLQDIPPRASLRSLTLQQTADPRDLTPLSQTREMNDPPLQPLHPVLPSLRPGYPAMPISDCPSDPAARPDEDRLSFLAKVAHANNDRPLES